LRFDLRARPSAKRKTYVDHIHALIDASAILGVNMVTTFLGRDPKKTVEENLEIAKEVWPPILGINYDPSHFVWQQIDYIKPIYEFKDRIFHVHYKDIKIYQDKLADVGVMACPLEYMTPKLPGLGDVDWGKYVSALTDIRCKGNSVIEVEDKACEGSLDDAKKAVIQSARYLRNFVI